MHVLIQHQVKIKVYSGQWLAPVVTIIIASVLCIYSVHWTLCCKMVPYVPQWKLPTYPTNVSLASFVRVFVKFFLQYWLWARRQNVLVSIDLRCHWSSECFVWCYTAFVVCVVLWTIVAFKFRKCSGSGFNWLFTVLICKLSCSMSKQQRFTCDAPRGAGRLSDQCRADTLWSLERR